MNLANDYKAVKLNMVDTKGTTIKKDILRLTSGDVLVVTVPKNTSSEEQANTFECIKDVINNDTRALLLPENVQLKILKKG